MNITYDLILDVTQDDCPVPTIKTKEVLDTLTSGYTLKVVTNKEGTINNLRTLVKNNAYELLKESKSDDLFNFYIKKL
ncbi:MAG: sulfurtransferase TusA family protein [Methylotenera sp.]|uniref:sulfurtransferase TusA family protein n=1 Tax=Methylotenera sp. TaxID=2051956 RepID=UPI00248822D8|nr:sulfurtransferase TusA family protein [Methylotenera sp.]MDI1309290.1 sulfurtransferase TusA family protein [Methylotenera sp.]